MALPKKLAKRNGYGIIENAIDPADGLPWDLYFSLKFIADRTKYRPASEEKIIRCCVTHSLAKAESIFQGLRDGQYGDGFCYVGFPTSTFTQNGIEIPAVDGMVFLVFVNDARTIFDWGWEPVDKSNPNFPNDFVGRFTKKAFP